MIETNLKPCPFCGGEAFVYSIPPHKHVFATFMTDYEGGAFAECSQCSCGLSGKTESDVIIAWNRRADNG